MNRTLPERIFICGFMGTGKTTVGQHLARQLHMEFYDLDQWIEEDEGRSIPVIFTEQGESAFRQIEKKALLQLIRTTQGVIALGGGSLHNQHLVDHVKVNGMLVFIETPLPLIIKRIKQSPDRPLLLNESGNIKSDKILKSDLQELYKMRYPLYEQAEVTVHAMEYDSLESLVTELVKKIRYHVALH